MKYIYGPIKSRRLGLSLGISLSPYKICTFDCIYCQLGSSGEVTGERKEYARAHDILEELKTWLVDNSQDAKQLDYITISGAGEPTLNIAIGEFIRQAKTVIPVPIAVITNSSLLIDPQVRHELLEADLLVPTLNTADSGIFKRLSRPEAGIKIEGIIEGLINLRKEYRGKIWIEIMLMRSVNEDIRQIKKIKSAIEMINPDKIQLNSPVRATAESGVKPVEIKKLEKIRQLFGDKCEIIS